MIYTANPAGALLLACLLFALAACGNKGPLFLPEEEAKKTQTQAE